MVSCAPLIASQSICELLFNTVFPWVFSFAIIYGLALRSNVFGGPETPAARGVSGIIGLVAGFLIVMAFGSSFGAFLAAVNGTIVMFAAVLLGIVLLFAMINPTLLGDFKGKQGLAVAAVLILIAGAIVSSFSLPTFSAIAFGQDMLALIIILIVVGTIVWFVSATGPAGGQSKGKSSSGESTI